MLIFAAGSGALEVGRLRGEKEEEKEQGDRKAAAKIGLLDRKAESEAEDSQSLADLN